MQLPKKKFLRDTAILAGVILLCLFIPKTFRKAGQNLFDEFRAPIDAVPSQLQDLEKFWQLHSNSKRALIEAGRDLARLNAAYKNKITENKFLQERLSRYESLLKIPSFDAYDPMVARVIRRDVNAWWQQIVIRRGYLDGVKEGYAVIYSGGVVGRVTEVNAYTSIVELLSSRGFRMAAYIEGCPNPVIYQGWGSSAFHSAYGEISAVQQHLIATKENPLKVYTSSLAGTFPEGIYIGSVSKLSFDDDSLFKTGIVDLSKELSDLREVLVLIPIEIKK